MKKFVLILFIGILVIVTWANMGDIENEDSRNSWYEPSTSQIGEIGRVLAKHNVSGCGEFHVQDRGYGSEYLVACTSDGKNWSYYVVYTASEDVLAANDKMIRELKPPR